MIHVLVRAPLPASTVFPSRAKKGRITVWYHKRPRLEKRNGKCYKLCRGFIHLDGTQDTSLGALNWNLQYMRKVPIHIKYFKKQYILSITIQISDSYIWNREQGTWTNDRDIPHVHFSKKYTFQHFILNTAIVNFLLNLNMKQLSNHIEQMWPNLVT